MLKRMKKYLNEDKGAPMAAPSLQKSYEDKDMQAVDEKVLIPEKPEIYVKITSTRQSQRTNPKKTECQYAYNSKNKNNSVTSISDEIYEVEDPAGCKHLLNLVLEKSSFSQQSYELYCKYQTTIHGDKLEDLKEESFTRFLVDSPITFTSISGADVAGFGSFHQKYFIDQKLIAISVIDILPKCVSAVYFIYDPDYSFLSLGNYSALREIAFTWRLSAQIPELKYYYMGKKEACLYQQDFLFQIALK